MRYVSVLTISGSTLSAQVWTTPDTAVAGVVFGSPAVLLNRAPGSGFDLVYYNRSEPDSNHYARYANGKWSKPVTVGGPARGILSLDYASTGARAAVWPGMPVPYVLLPAEMTLTRDSSGGWTSGSLFYRDTLVPAMFPAVRFDRNDTFYLAWLKGSNNYMDPSPGDIFAGKIVGNVLVDTANVSKMNLGGQYVNLVRDSSGSLHLAWEAQDQSLVLTQYHAVRTSAGWTPAQEVGTGQATFLNVDRMGNLHMVSREGAGPEVQYRSFDGHTWSAATKLSRGQVYTGTGGWEVRLRFDSRNRPVVMWGGRTLCIKSDGHWSLPRTIPTEKPMDRESDFQVGDDDSLHLVWQEGSSLLHSVVAIDTVPPLFIRAAATARNTYTACKPISVSWSTEDQQEVMENLVEFSRDGGNSWEMIDTLMGHPDSISWTLPRMYSDSCLIRISCDDYWYNRAVSTTERFRIINEPPTPPVLQQPPDSLHIKSPGIWFGWFASSDAPCDTIRYFLHLWSDTRDTIVGPLTVSPFYFNGSQWFKKDTTYCWTVIASDGRDSSSGTQGVWRFFLPDTLVPVESKPEVQHEFSLDQNYPNPFNPGTTIRYGLPHRSLVRLALVNILGQEVRVLVEGDQERGFYEIELDASGLASGVYLYRLAAGEVVLARKLLLIR